MFECIYVSDNARKMRCSPSWRLIIRNQPQRRPHRGGPAHHSTAAMTTSRSSSTSPRTSRSQASSTSRRLSSRRCRSKLSNKRCRSVALQSQLLLSDHAQTLLHLPQLLLGILHPLAQRVLHLLQPLLPLLEEHLDIHPLQPDLQILQPLLLLLELHGVGWWQGLSGVHPSQSRQVKAATAAGQVTVTVTVTVTVIRHRHRDMSCALPRLLTSPTPCISYPWQDLA